MPHERTPRQTTKSFLKPRRSPSPPINRLKVGPALPSAPPLNFQRLTLNCVRPLRKLHHFCLVSAPAAAQATTLSQPFQANSSQFKTFQGRRLRCRAVPSPRGPEDGILLRLSPPSLLIQLFAFLVCFVVSRISRWRCALLGALCKRHLPRRHPPPDEAHLSTKPVHSVCISEAIGEDPARVYEISYAGPRAFSGGRRSSVPGLPTSGSGDEAPCLETRTRYDQKRTWGTLARRRCLEVLLL